MEVFYSIQELVELQINMQNPNYPNNRQGFETFFLIFMFNRTSNKERTDM